jgi:hypothetical protein
MAFLYRRYLIKGFLFLLQVFAVLLMAHQSQAIVLQLKCEDQVYLATLKTDLLYRDGFELSSPIIQLNGNDKLRLSFDDLDLNLRSYSYTFVHCDAAWNPSNLTTSDYIDGYTEDKISNYQFSFNTKQKYVHYSLVFPTETVKPTKSGNYIIKVFADYDPNKVVLTKRFMIFDPKIEIEATVKPNPMDQMRKQDINFTLNCSNYVIDNPQIEVKVNICQNGRTDNSISNLKPLFIRENQLIYTYDSGNSFNGGNEFRILDIRSLRFQSDRILKFDADSAKNNHVFLLSDEVRQYMRYSTYSDINGRFKIKSQEGMNSELEADYAFVHFAISFDNPINDGSFYVFGALSNWKADSHFLLTYNSKKFVYEGVAYLKQGYYNYQYAFVKDKTDKIEEGLTEGNHSETENDYAIYVYHRPMGARYDQLIGIKQLNSAQGY